MLLIQQLNRSKNEGLIFDKYPPRSCHCEILGHVSNTLSIYFVKIFGEEALERVLLEIWSSLVHFHGVF